MVADIRIKTSFHGHRKRRKLKLLLGQDGTGYVLDLWINAALNHPDGVLRGMDHEDIALDAGWDGDARMFTEALLAVAFLDLIDGVYVLHDWAEHQSWVIGSTARRDKAKMAASARWARGQEEAETQAEAVGDDGPNPPKMPEVGQKTGQAMLGACSQHACSIPGACHEHARSNAPLLSSSSPEDSKNPPVPTTVGTSPRAGGTPYSAAFEAWWAEYPNKKAKGYAWKCWRKIKDVGADVLLAALRAQKAAQGHWTVGKEVCIPHPSTWLNKRCWEDEVKAQPMSAAAKLRASIQAREGGDES